eukprot:6197891-Pleurochrysis_carterae.AAC.3
MQCQWPRVAVGLKLWLTLNRNCISGTLCQSDWLQLVLGRTRDIIISKSICQLDRQSLALLRSFESTKCFYKQAGLPAHIWLYRVCKPVLPRVGPSKRDFLQCHRLGAARTRASAADSAADAKIGRSLSACNALTIQAQYELKYHLLTGSSH